MAISVTCPDCHSGLEAADKLAGKYANCTNCGCRIYIDAPSLQGERARSTTSDYSLSPLEERLPASSATDARDHVNPTPEAATCAKCGQALPAGEEHCQNCYYHAGLKRVVDTRDDDQQDEGVAAFGFRKYLQQKLSKGQSPESVFYLIDFFLCLLLFAITVWFGLPFYSGLILMGFYITYRVFVQTTGRVHRGASFLWLTVLFFGRSLGWRTFGGNARLNCDYRKPGFGDSDLVAIENLPHLQVLDLEGASISDAGLVHLEDHRQLEFLILRKTSVSADGVWRLQQTIPATCIWY